MMHMLRFRSVLRALAALAASMPAAARADGKLALPEPAMPAPREVVEQGESPVYYRSPDDTLLPSARLNLGTATRLAEVGETPKTAFRLDLLAGAAFAPARGSRFAVLGELGYSYVGFSEHYFTAGLGPLLRLKGPVFGDDRSFGDQVWLGVVPRGLVGSADGALAVGLRTAVLLGWEGWGVELGHQYVTTDTRRVQELDIAFTMYVWYPARYR
jgi:hypothetical protein